MKYKKGLLFIILTICAMVTAQSQEGVEEDTLGDYRQYVSWGVVAGPNCTLFMTNTDALQDAPDRTSAGVGLDGGLFFDYHISQKWSLQMITTGTVERLTQIYGDEKNNLGVFGIDVSLPACYKTGSWQLSAGFFCHYTTGSILSNLKVANPYSRTGGIDIRTGNPTYSLSDFYAGITLGAGYDISEKLTLRLNVLAGCTNMLDYRDGNQYVIPIKTALHILYNFD